MQDRDIEDTRQPAERSSAKCDYCQAEYGIDDLHEFGLDLLLCAECLEIAKSGEEWEDA